MFSVLKKTLVLTVLALLALPTIAFASDIVEEKFELDEGEFKVEGIVTSTGGDSFVVAGHTIMIDPAMVEELTLEGTVATGAEVRAEGIVSDGTLLAEEVRVEEAEDVELEEIELEDIEFEDIELD